MCFKHVKLRLSLNFFQLDELENFVIIHRKTQVYLVDGLINFFKNLYFQCFAKATYFMRKQFFSLQRGDQGDQRGASNPQEDCQLTLMLRRMRPQPAVYRYIELEFSPCGAHLVLLLQPRSGFGEHFGSCELSVA